MQCPYKLSNYGMLFSLLLVGLFAISAAAQEYGEIAAQFQFDQAPAQSTVVISCTLLADADNLAAQIDALRERSKPDLEPLVKQYMACAETLQQLALQVPRPIAAQQRTLAEFTATERNIQDILARYRKEIENLLQRQTVRTANPVVSGDRCRFPTLPPGNYRLYGVMTFATTTLRWFEPILLKGGERRTVQLTRANLSNPYWTDLNWWSFINLDFSKHH